MAERNRPTTFGELAPSAYPGERLGLPETGSGSVGRLGRRVLAIVIDWGLAAAIAYSLFREPNTQTLMNLVIFGVMQVLFIPTIGGSLGHRICGMRVVPIAGGWVGPWRPLVRTLLLLLVIPLLVWDSDQRAFHDKIAGTVLIRA